MTFDLTRNNTGDKWVTAVTRVRSGCGATQAWYTTATAPLHPQVDDGRVRKRRRAASDPHWRHHPCAPAPDFGPPHNLEHDPEFWFEDGSVVLIIQNIGFCVYKQLLAEHSPFFRDLFRIPQPVPTQKIEECPLVVLSDYACQFRHFLRALFPTKSNLTFGARQDHLSMDALFAVVLLAHKYQVDQLVAQGLAHLMEYYTDDFAEWTRGRSGERPAHQPQRMKIRTPATKVGGGPL
ncbi:hypothetical protein LXA43DRAFT_1108555 [Ganoderma leucocontextum]|nr:hypothetical protein LXA43DRAFT_1108555 [Ganoderma leucocontextum]